MKGSHYLSLFACNLLFESWESETFIMPGSVNPALNCQSGLIQLEILALLQKASFFIHLHDKERIIKQVFGALQ